ncbi:hypothetical protein DSECCO2_120070 [anaerobic digester metagenome]
MLAQVNPETINSITSIATTGIIVTAVVYVAKLIIAKLIDRYFASIDTRNKEFKQVTTDLQNVTNDIKTIAESLLHQKETTEEFKTQIESRLENLTEQQNRDLLKLQIKLEEKIDNFEDRVNEGFMRVKDDIKNVKIDYGMQFTELRKRIDKQDDEIAKDRECIVELKYKK